VCIAKGIASGMPLSAIVTRKDIMDWVPGSHASTFGGNPVCIAAALATMKVLEREGITNCEAVGRHIMQRISSWPQKYDMVGDVRGRGLMIGVELVTDKQSKAPAGPARDKVVEMAFERGCLFLGAGENSVRICPPLIITKEQADAGLDILEECISTVDKSAKAEQPGKGKPQGA
jgi:4-aminobutyrate aminotransferase